MEAAAEKKQKTAMPPLQLAETIARLASDGKAEDIVLLNVQGISTVTDFFVILTGTSQTHLRALARRIEDELRASGNKPANIDGARTTGWIAIDYGSVIVHAMTQDSRQVYNLERLWGDAPRTEWQ